MAETVVIYKSKYGTTKQYAEWIADELHADIYEALKVLKPILREYSAVILGGGLYASGIGGIDIII